LVDVGAEITPYKIRKANNYFMEAALQRTGLFDVDSFHFADNKKVLWTQLKVILESFDCLVLSGGVSMGKFDLIPQVMEELGVKVLFHKVQQKPGRPFWYGVSQDKKPVFALPGNPLSTQMCIYRFVIPHLVKALGIELKPKVAVLMKDFKPDTKFTYYLPVKVHFNKKGILEAEPVLPGGSGDFASTALSDGFIELPDGGKLVKKGFCAHFYEW
jgi:molybdopterin molybdotransferase